MKIKLLVLLTGTFLAVAYLIGCGGGGNNNNTSCPAGETWNGSTCVVGLGVNSYQNCIQYGQGTPAYTQCIASSGCGVGVTSGYPYGTPGYGYGTTAGYPQQNCGAPGATGYPYGQPYGYGGYQSGYGYSPYPPQGGYNYYPYGYPYQQSGISFGVSYH